MTQPLTKAVANLEDSLAAQYKHSLMSLKWVDELVKKEKVLNDKTLVANFLDDFMATIV